MTYRGRVAQPARTVEPAASTEELVFFAWLSIFQDAIGAGLRPEDPMGGHDCLPERRLHLRERDRPRRKGREFVELRREAGQVQRPAFRTPHGEISRQ